MESKLISIIVPVYNVDRYLDKCVKSIFNQTYKNLEIILVDDGSSDKSPEMCDRYAALDKRVNVIHQKNGGLADARNRGLEVSNGEYVIFVDSDDYINENMCEVISEYINDYPDVIVTDGIAVGCHINLSHPHLQIGYLYNGKEYLKECLTGGNLAMEVWLNVYKRSFLIQNRLKFKTGILHEDEQFTPRVLLKAERVVYTGTAHYHYIIRENSITTKKDQRKNAQDLYAICLELTNIYEEIEDKELKNYLNDYLVCNYLSLFQSAELYRYGNEYIKKDFVKKYSYKLRTKLKALLFCISPILYWNINNTVKKIKFQ